VDRPGSVVSISWIACFKKVEGFEPKYGGGLAKLAKRLDGGGRYFFKITTLTFSYGVLPFSASTISTPSSAINSLGILSRSKSTRE